MAGWCGAVGSGACREGGSDVREPTASPVTYLLYVFLMKLQSICTAFAKYLRYLLSIFNSRAQLDQLDLVVRKRGIRCHIDLSTTAAAAPFNQKMSRVFNVFVIMHLNVFAYHLYGICKVFLSICRVK